MTNEEEETFYHYLHQYPPYIYIHLGDRLDKKTFASLFHILCLLSIFIYFMLGIKISFVYFTKLFSFRVFNGLWLPGSIKRSSRSTAWKSASYFAYFLIPVNGSSLCLPQIMELGRSSG